MNLPTSPNDLSPEMVQAIGYGFKKRHPKRIPKLYLFLFCYPDFDRLHNIAESLIETNPNAFNIKEAWIYLAKIWLQNSANYISRTINAYVFSAFNISLDARNRTSSYNHFIEVIDRLLPMDNKPASVIQCV